MLNTIKNKKEKVNPRPDNYRHLSGKNQNASRSIGIAIALYVLTCFPPFGGIEGGCQNVGINSTGALPSASAMLDVSSTSKGLLIPRVSLTSTTDVVTIASPATSLLVYNTNAAMTGGAVGYWYWDGAKWVQFGTGGGSNDWTLLGNAGTIDGTNFLGTTDNVPINFRVNNEKAGRIGSAGPVFLGYQAGNVNVDLTNTGIGYQALFSNTTAVHNTAIGYQALMSNTTGWANTAMGIGALTYNISGSFNTVMGRFAMWNNTTGTQNTGIGHWALKDNTTGGYNTAIGASANEKNTVGAQNTAIGHNALWDNTSGSYNTVLGSGNFTTGTAFWNSTGSQNTAIGLEALYSNTTGNNNTAVGYQAGYGAGGPVSSSDVILNNSFFGYKAGFGITTGGNNNTAAGYEALRSNTTGYSNAAVGIRALYSNTFRPNLVAIGDSALYNNGTGASGPFEAGGNTAVGSKALYANTKGFFNTATSVHALFSNTTGSYNTANGFFALRDNTTGSNNTALGYAAFSTGTVYTNSTALGANTVITASNQVRLGDNTGGMSIGGYAAWTNLSDGRFKKDVNENVPGLEFIMKLRPVTYHFDINNIDDFVNKPDNLRSHSNGDLFLQTGFIAQEVEAAANEIDFDFNGVDKPKNENDYYGLRYASFTVPLVKAVQEQQKMIEFLQLENKRLNAENNILHSQQKDVLNDIRNLSLQITEIKVMMGGTSIASAEKQKHGYEKK